MSPGPTRARERELAPGFTQNIKSGWIGSPVENTLAYHTSLSVNKLERLPLAMLFNLDLYLRVSKGPTRARKRELAPGFIPNIRSGWIGSPVENTLAYYTSSSIIS